MSTALEGGMDSEEWVRGSIECGIGRQLRDDEWEARKKVHENALAISLHQQLSEAQKEADRNWRLLLLEISKTFAHFDGEWEDATVHEMDEFDPWDALRRIHAYVVEAANKFNSRSGEWLSEKEHAESAEKRVVELTAERDEAQRCVRIAGEGWKRAEKRVAELEAENAALKGKVGK